MVRLNLKARENSQAMVPHLKYYFVRLTFSELFRVTWGEHIFFANKQKTLMKSYLLTWLFSLIYVIINKILNTKISNNWDEHQVSSLGLIILFLYQHKKKNFEWVSIAFIKIIVHIRIYSLNLQFPSANSQPEVTKIVLSN